MLTIMVNGNEKKLNIGCRTFVSLDVLLRILESNDQEVTLNGETVYSQGFGMTTVKCGDTLGLACEK